MPLGLPIGQWQGVFQMAKNYKTFSGTYSEEEMVIAIWANPNRKSKRPNARPLETFTAKKSLYPIAFPLELLQKIESWMYCKVAASVEDIDDVIFGGKATREKPLLVPLRLAKDYLGWQVFYIPTEYKELSESLR